MMDGIWDGGGQAILKRFWRTVFRVVTSLIRRYIINPWFLVSERTCFTWNSYSWGLRRVHPMGYTVQTIHRRPSTASTQIRSELVCRAKHQEHKGLLKESCSKCIYCYLFFPIFTEALIDPTLQRYLVTVMWLKRKTYLKSLSKD